MILFFKKMRQKILTKNKFSRYLLYAIGEIILVVIGILIALSINNWNEARKEREKEINYLKNLRTDLVSELENNEYFGKLRFEIVKECSFLLNSVPPRTLNDIKAYTDKYEKVFYWHAFVPSNNTFKELLSSGNLNIIKNDSIKHALLELDKMYAEIYNGEHHMRRDFEQYLYDVVYKKIAAFTFFDISKPRHKFERDLKIEDIPKEQIKKLIEETQWLSTNQIFNNGLKLAMINSSSLANMHRNMAQFIQKLINFIEEEINK